MTDIDTQRHSPSAVTAGIGAVTPSGPEGASGEASDLDELSNIMLFADRLNGPCHPLTLGSSTRLALSVAETLAGSGLKMTPEAARAEALPPSDVQPGNGHHVSGLWHPHSPSALYWLAASVAGIHGIVGDARHSPTACVPPAPVQSLPEGFAVRTLRRLAAVLDHAGHMENSQQCYHMAYGCIQLPSGKGGRRCPFAHCHDHEAGTDIDWDEWLAEASEVLLATGRNLRAEFGDGHPHVLEADMLTDFILNCDGDLGRPDTESRARFSSELRRHLARQLDEADRKIALGRCREAIDICSGVMNTTFMNPPPFGEIQVRCSECEGRASFSASYASHAHLMFSSACDIAIEAGIGPENPDVQAAQVGIAISKREVEGRGKRAISFSGLPHPFSMIAIERHLGTLNEIALKASAARQCALPRLTAF
ncbi:MAG: hypothetical protein LBT40_07620 [Deltaproteobacteria bacterium]|jgi:hypothetical protein|nr:hypothetical protein [Deltaproteobacteria bacterium]